MKKGRLNLTDKISKDFAAAARRSKSTPFHFRLYISGTTPQSQRAVANLKWICDTHLDGRHSLEIIDVYQTPTRAKEDQIIAVPTLVKVSPAPMRQLLGDLSDRPRILNALGIVSAKASKKGNR